MCTSAEVETVRKGLGELSEADLKCVEPFLCCFRRGVQPCGAVQAGLPCCMGCSSAHFGQHARSQRTVGKKKYGDRALQGFGRTRFGGQCSQSPMAMQSLRGACRCAAPQDDEAPPFPKLLELNYLCDAGADDACITRHLMARKNDVVKATAQVKDTINFRNEVKISEMHSSEFRNMLNLSLIHI